jgi:hypothetical protein
MWRIGPVPCEGLAQFFWNKFWNKTSTVPVVAAFAVSPAGRSRAAP